MLGLLAMLAIVGVAMLLLLALGVIRFGGRRPGIDIARRLSRHARRGGAARRRRRSHPLCQSRLCRPDRRRRATGRCAPSSGSSPATPRPPRRSTALAQAVREGKAAEEEVRLPAPLSGAARRRRPLVPHQGAADAVGDGQATLTPRGRSPTSPASGRSRSRCSRSCSTPSTISTTRPPASSRPSPTGGSSISTRPSPNGSASTSPSSRPGR